MFLGSFWQVFQQAFKPSQLSIIQFSFWFLIIRNGDVLISSAFKVIVTKQQIIGSVINTWLKSQTCSLPLKKQQQKADVGWIPIIPNTNAVMVILKCSQTSRICYIDGSDFTRHESDGETNPETCMSSGEDHSTVCLPVPYRRGGCNHLTQLDHHYRGISSWKCRWTLYL